MGGGGSIVGITPGAVLEKKSVRDIAAGLNKLGKNWMKIEQLSLITGTNQLNSPYHFHLILIFCFCFIFF